MNALQTYLCITLLIPFLNNGANKERQFFEKRKKEKTAIQSATKTIELECTPATSEPLQESLERQESFELVDPSQEQSSPKIKSLRDIMYQDPSQYANSYKGKKHTINTSEEGSTVSEEQKEFHKKKLDSVLKSLTENKKVKELSEKTHEFTINPVEGVSDSLELLFDSNPINTNVIDLRSYQLTQEQKDWLLNLMLVLNFKKDDIIQAHKTLRTKEFFDALGKIREETRKYKDLLEAQKKTIAYEIKATLCSSASQKETSSYINEMRIIPSLKLNGLTKEAFDTKIAERDAQVIENRKALAEARRLFIETSMNNHRITRYSKRRNDLLVNLHDTMSSDFGQNTTSIAKRFGF